jgi:hypothetical protein
MGLRRGRWIMQVIPRYPHMGPEEAKIWHKFLAMAPMNFIRIQYDVHVGTGYVPEYLIKEYRQKLELYKKGLISYDEVKITEAIIKSVQSLTQLRIDAVAETNQHIWIFEVKPRAGRSALGQLESYYYWYIRQYRPTKPVRLGVVCYEVDPNLEPIFQSKNIEIFKVPR